MKWSHVLIVICGAPAFLFGAALRVPLSTLPGTVPGPAAVIEELSDSVAAPPEPPPTNVETDLNGNQVDSAVATYQIDAAGTIYERHAPDTAVLKLGPPRM